MLDFLNNLGMYRHPQIYDKLQCIFIHIPKAAGTSIELKLKEINDKHQMIGGHSTAFSIMKNKPKVYQNYFTFTLVRHPYERLYSAYKYLINMKTHENLGNEQIKHFANFEEFVKTFLNEKTIHSNIHIKPQTHFICHNDNIIVDYWDKYENIETFWDNLQRKLNFESQLPWLNKTTDKKKLVISQEIKDKIYRLYKVDFITFSYNK